MFKGAYIKLLFFMPINIDHLEQEFYYKTLRSSGKGGQNVNKVESKVEVYFNVLESKVLSEEQKIVLQNTFQKKLSAEGTLKVTSQKYRSQFQNKEEATQKMLALISKSLVSVKPRKKTKKPKSAIVKRITEKKLVSDKKQMRRKPEL